METPSSNSELNPKPISSSSNVSDQNSLSSNTSEFPSIGYFCIFTTLLGHNEEDRQKQILYYGTPTNFNTSLEKIVSTQAEEGLNEEERTKTDRGNFSNQVNETEVNMRCQDVCLDTQVRQVGLAQAMTNFSKIFSSESCDNVHSKKARLVLYEPEPEFHFVLRVNLGVRIRISETDKKSAVVDYLDRELSDLALQGVLRQAYTRFKIGHGSLQSILRLEGRDKLQKSLELFFDGYLGTVINVRHLDIVAGMNGLPILPVTKATFLQVQATLKSIHRAFPSLEAAGLIHQGRLVWSGTHLPGDAALFMTDLAKGGPSLAKNPLPPSDKPRLSFLSALNPFFTPTSSKQASAQKQPTNFHPGFYTGWDPKSPYWGRTGQDESCETPLKTLYLGSPLQPFQCGLFEGWSDGYLVLIFSGGPLDPKLMNELELHLYTQPFTDLESRVKVDALLAQEQASPIDKQYHYVHYNGMNLALHSHLSSLTPEVHTLLLDLQSQANKLRPSSQSAAPLELLHRPAASTGKPALWVGAKVTSDSTLFFVIHKDDTLAEIEDDIAKISNASFTNLLLG